MNEELKHVINSVKKSVVYSYPYDYCYITNFFSDSFYKEILKNLPADDKFTECQFNYNKRKGISSNRYMISMKKCNNEIIQEVAKILMSKELEDVYFAKFEKVLIRDQEDRIPVSCNPTIYRDKPGYYIHPHTDVSSKIITTQIYLPEDNTRENIGTIINIREDKSQYEKYKQLKFHRNTSYALIPSANSWHSVDILTEDNFDRNTIMFTYYKNKKK